MRTLPSLIALVFGSTMLVTSVSAGENGSHKEYPSGENGKTCIVVYSHGETVSQEEVQVVLVKEGLRCTKFA